ncbi:MAG: hypothetical protein IPL53_12015 [Ignavibacteria bacterium]|nr:hypothetical protein [Ignavibacteria bacterium]
MKLKTAESLICFTNKIIDYAGLFPPAKLSLPDALKNYYEYRKGRYDFMLSKFICPVKQLPELEILLVNNYSDQEMISVSVLSSGGNRVDDFKNNLKNDLTVWKEFHLNNKEKVSTNSFELKLPDELIFENDSKNISSFIDFISESIKEEISEPVIIYIEGNMNNEYEANSKSVIEGIEIHNFKNFNAGFKLRTGGVEAAAFPSSEAIAFCIRRCLDKKVPVKFTAGLHHPFRHYDTGIGTMMHGFINVFGAGIIAMRHDISDHGMAEILNDEDPADFIFTDDYFSWKDWKIEIADIKYARKNLVLSYGSCSFDEPVDDLKSLKLLQ